VRLRRLAANTIRAALSALLATGLKSLAINAYGLSNGSVKIQGMPSVIRFGENENKKQHD
jgi:hypothetical protein